MADENNAIPPTIDSSVRGEAAVHRGNKAAAKENEKPLEVNPHPPRDRRTKSKSRTRSQSRTRTPRSTRRSKSKSRGRSETRRSRSPRQRLHSRSRRDWRRGSRHRSPPRREEEHDYYDYYYEEPYEGQDKDPPYEDQYEDPPHYNPRRSRSRSMSVLSGISVEDSERSRHSEKENEDGDDASSNTRKRKSRYPTQDKTDDTPTTKRKRFEAKSEEEKRDWSLKRKDARYKNKALATYLSNKTLEDSILKDNPVPKNIDKPEELDDTWETRLERRHRDSIDADNAFKKIQGNLRKVFGPLSKLYNDTAEGTDKSKDKILTSLEQTMIVVGKVNNDIT